MAPAPSYVVTDTAAIMIMRRITCGIISISKIYYFIFDPENQNFKYFRSGFYYWKY